LANNPTWNSIANNAYSIVNGELHSDGLIMDQSDRYRNVYRSDVSLQALDYLEFSYRGLLKQVGNPQTGRGTKVIIIGTDGNNYQLNIQRGFVDSFPNNKFSLSLSAGTSTQFDLVVTSFQPDYDQIYDIRAVRQSGIWTLYISSSTMTCSMAKLTASGQRIWVSIGTSPSLAIAKRLVPDFTHLSHSAISRTLRENPFLVARSVHIK
jgi:hypothetical protein